MTAGYRQLFAAHQLKPNKDGRRRNRTQPDADYGRVRAGIVDLLQTTLTISTSAAHSARLDAPAWWTTGLGTTLAGIFLLVWSDTELWPFGHRHWLEALQNNREVLQHKTFAVLLLLFGAIEFERVRGRLLAAWSGWVFPLVAICGSILLVFHQHEGGMVGEHHMETMARIQSQHLSYTACGFGIGLTKGLSELETIRAGFFAKLWPLFLATLGVLLMFYKE